MPARHGLLRAACLPFPPPGQEQWTVEGVEPSFAGCKPTVFPLDDTPKHRTSGPGGGRTHIPLFKRQVLRRLSYKAGQSVCRAGVEPAQQCGWVTVTWARQCPADTSVPWMGFEPTICTLRECRPLRAGLPGYFRDLKASPLGSQSTPSCVSALVPPQLLDVVSGSGFSEIREKSKWITHWAVPQRRSVRRPL